MTTLSELSRMSLDARLDAIDRVLAGKMWTSEIRLFTAYAISALVETGIGPAFDVAMACLAKHAAAYQRWTVTPLPADLMALIVAWAGDGAIIPIIERVLAE